MRPASASKRSPCGLCAHEVGRPAVHLVQVGEAALRQRAQQVQHRGRMRVGAQQPLRVGRACGGAELAAVDDVAAVGGQGDAVHRLHVRRARLGELPGDAPELDHRAGGAVGQHHRHLQDARGRCRARCRCRVRRSSRRSRRPAAGRPRRAPPRPGASRSASASPAKISAGQPASCRSAAPARRRRGRLGNCRAVRCRQLSGDQDSVMRRHSRRAVTPDAAL